MGFHNGSHRWTSKKSSSPPQLDPCEYKVGATISKGGYSTVKELVHVKTHCRYAAKVLKKSKKGNHSRAMCNEIRILRKVSLKHPNVLSLDDCFETPNSVYLVTGLCTGGDLFDYVSEYGPLAEKEVRPIIRGVLSGIQFLHENGIVHHDIKPENIIFRSTDSRDMPIIADFGMAELLDDKNSCSHIGGTPGYIAPEILKCSVHDSSVDMWSLGILTYFSLSGHTPFGTGGFDRHTCDEMVAGNFKFTPSHIWNRVSCCAKNFIQSLLVVDPKSRMTANEALNHNWLTGSVRSNSEDKASASRLSDFRCKHKSFSDKADLPQQWNLMPGLKGQFVSNTKEARSQRWVGASDVAIYDHSLLSSYDIQRRISLTKSRFGHHRKPTPSVRPSLGSTLPNTPRRCFSRPIRNMKSSLFTDDERTPSTTSIFAYSFGQSEAAKSNPQLPDLCPDYNGPDTPVHPDSINIDTPKPDNYSWDLIKSGENSPLPEKSALNYNNYPGLTGLLPSEPKNNLEVYLSKVTII
ncbi:Calcium/calmodulin-dependent protein kinase type I [Mycoemilia scoparia]|uniref:Calcium/calmodulin-dependent protein kinase type I n=1 Tax=Mycoemilia scoparia TaxID=417184 RepID=A0A9W7ZZY3_9FUNG|nr:Calcium/calmodulin-dependent protein kinase type I [Mycoemilia scoparia]